MKSLRAFWKLLKSKGRETTECREREGPREPSVPPATFAIRRKERKGEKVSIQVGLDFGTSCTKVAYSQRGTRFFKSICFDHALPGYPAYCLPSLAAVDSRGELLLGPAAVQELADQHWDRGLRRFKVLVAGQVDPSFEDPITRQGFQKYCIESCCRHLTPDRLTAIFLAWTMTETRKHICSLPEYQGADIDMAFNVCVPIDQVEKTSVRQEFERIFRWAELIHDEWRKKPSNFDSLEASYRLENKTDILPKSERRVFSIPESVAQVASYLVSLQRKEGLHAVIDLGAGTTDVSIFNLSLLSGSATSYWYAARNIPQGMDRIERRVAEQLHEDSRSGKCCAERVSEMMEFLSLNPRKANVVREELKKIWSSEDYHRTWGTAYHYKLKKQTSWENVEVFVSGGGSGFSDPAAAIFSRPWQWSNLKCSYRVGELPEPDDYAPQFCEAPFSRMSVAYGLAIPRPALEEYVLPSVTPDQTPAALPELKFDRDDLYPKP